MNRQVRPSRDHSIITSPRNNRAFGFVGRVSEEPRASLRGEAREASSPAEHLSQPGPGSSAVQSRAGSQPGTEQLSCFLQVSQEGRPETPSLRRWPNGDAALRVCTPLTGECWARSERNDASVLDGGAKGHHYLTADTHEYIEPRHPRPGNFQPVYRSIRTPQSQNRLNQTVITRHKFSSNQNVRIRYAL